MNRRKSARIILYLRRIAIAKVVAEFIGEDATKLEADFVNIAAMLPWSIHAGNGLNRRVTLPAYRKLNREGIISQTFYRE